MSFQLTNDYLNNRYTDHLLFIIFVMNYIHNIAPFIKSFVLKALLLKFFSSPLIADHFLNLAHVIFAPHV